MDKTLIFGHKSPDTDTICSALAYADLKTALGMKAEARKLGPVNKETQYVLDYFQVTAPASMESLEKDSDVILVDHNEFQQSADNIQEARIVEVIDHHKIANFETKEPLYFRAEPVGCTATIINKMYKENDIHVSGQMAGLLLSSIISDTLLLQSPTCTDEDVKAAEELAAKAEVNLNEYGLEMLKAGADLGDKSIEELLTMDAKEFDMNGSNVMIAQVNTVDTSDVFKQQDDLEKGIQDLIAKKDLDLFLFVVTDILENDSEVLALGNGSTCVEKAFNVSLEENRAVLKGVVSRKKQIVNALTEAFEKENTAS